MSASRDKIIEARRLVADFESGKVSLTEIINRSHQVAFPQVSRLTDLAELAAAVYFKFRLIEAAAYAMRGKQDPAVELYCGFAKGYESLLTERLTVVERLEPKSELEAIGLFCVQEKLEWALWLIRESFPAWGY